MNANSEDLHEFFKMFNIRIENDVELPVKWSIVPSINLEDPVTATMQSKFEKGYQLSISIKQLDRLVKILKNKGYFHDDDYSIRIREEELILSNPALKQLHDQYKTYLYMLNGEDYANHD